MATAADPAWERRRRAAGQLLHRPARGTPAGVVRHLLAVQSQDERASRLALRARIPGLRAGAVDDAFARGELVTTWLMRGTLHTVAAEDRPWLHALTAPRAAAQNRRRLGQEGVGAAEAGRAVELLAADGPLTREEAADRLGRSGQALAHLLLFAALAGRIVLGPGRAIVPVEPPAVVDRDAALGELGRRYRAAHPGAGPEDLARWSGLPVGEARQALHAVPADRARDPPPAPLRLLPAFDELLLGWADRTPVVAAEHARAVQPGGGIVRAVVLVDGEAAGTWTARGIEPFPGRRIDPEALAAERADVERFLAGAA